MNRYGLMARQHWERWLPRRYAQVSDPDQFFTDLGRQVAERVDQLALQFAGDDQPGEGYLGKAGRLGQARHQAEEIVLAEMVCWNRSPGPRTTTRRRRASRYRQWQSGRRSLRSPAPRCPLPGCTRVASAYAEFTRAGAGTVAARRR